MSGDTRTGPAWQAVAAGAASLLPRYPDPDVLAALPTIDAALDALPTIDAGPLRQVADHRTRTDASQLAAYYVQLFDFRRRCSLRLTYYTCGDTRKRGEALVRFATVYKAAGLELVDGELPDYLPAVLDLAAVTAAAGDDVDGRGWPLLREYRIGLDLLVKALAAEASVYRHVVDAVRVLLPAPRPADLAAAAGPVRTGPPQETVGLEPFGLVDTSGGRR